MKINHYSCCSCLLSKQNTPNTVYIFFLSVPCERDECWHLPFSQCFCFFPWFLLIHMWKRIERNEKKNDINYSSLYLCFNWIISSFGAMTKPSLSFLIDWCVLSPHSIKEYVLRRRTRSILISIRAKRIPTQFHGPAPNGIQAIGWRFVVNHSG